MNNGLDEFCAFDELLEKAISEQEYKSRKYSFKYLKEDIKYWYDDALKLNKEDEYSKKLIKCYLDNIHINENNTLIIREVDIHINTDLKFN